MFLFPAFFLLLAVVFAAIYAVAAKLAVRCLGMKHITWTQAFRFGFFTVVAVVITMTSLQMQMPRSAASMSMWLTPLFVGFCYFSRKELVSEDSAFDWRRGVKLSLLCVAFAFFICASISVYFVFMEPPLPIGA